MPAPFTASPEALIELTTGIVVAYVSSNSVPASELPLLIVRVHRAITERTSSTESVNPATTEPSDRPNAAQIRRSFDKDGIISFIDGKIYKTLKRHLTSHGLDPNSYRVRYGLPADYPMVAPSYAERRSALAKAIGLGRPGAMTERERRKIS
ncbi:MucR family transcriptional regulator [Methylobacterium sp. SD21]|uniref:MucR family transcriptional regulator n=1 Tax=Methylobacterium litchii TaxID=3138810 RepID=UPI00313F0573